MTEAAKKSSHYVNNKDFSLAVVEYVKSVKAAEAAGLPIPIVTDYIAECFLKISEGLSHKSNFIRYTYREEMVMDAVENCLKAITNYNIDAATRTGAPNAFSYFTQICYFAFLRRLAKEKRQQDIKYRYIEQAGIEEFMAYAEDGDFDPGTNRNFIDQLRGRIDRVRDQDKALKEYAATQKKGKGKKPLDETDVNDEDIDLSGVEMFMKSLPEGWDD
jgi:hypothetical protein